MNKNDGLVDSSWSILYKIGGISAILYVLLAVVIPFFMFINHTELVGMVNGFQLMNYIQQNGSIWWLSLQTLVLCGSFFAIITFAALFIVLKRLEKSLAAIGSLLAIVMHILFIAYYPILLGITTLFDGFQTATQTQQASLASAAEALLAMNNAFNPVYETVFAISILILSIVMLKGIFNKKIAYIGIATGISEFILISLFPVIGVNYFWWWMFFNVWFVLIGVKLYRLGKLTP
jgi:hypothetical protein